uniref:Uncharacterized protein n=1 Tax=Arundo donax TaxID=35708 RepID=A0A0A9AQX3_ARUDO
MIYLCFGSQELGFMFSIPKFTKQSILRRNNNNCTSSDKDLDTNVYLVAFIILSSIHTKEVGYVIAPFWSS